MALLVLVQSTDVSIVNASDTFLELTGWSREFLGNFWVNSSNLYAEWLKIKTSKHMRAYTNLNDQLYLCSVEALQFS